MSRGRSVVAAVLLALATGCADATQQQTVNVGSGTMPIHTPVSREAARAWLAAQPWWPDHAQQLGVVLNTSMHKGVWYALILPQNGHEEVVMADGCTDSQAVRLLVQPGAAVAYRHRASGTIVFGPRAWKNVGCQHSDEVVNGEAIPMTPATKPR